ncbi:jg6934, partial [Pararge aegeria aegeria]
VKKEIGSEIKTENLTSIMLEASEKWESIKKYMVEIIKVKERDEREGSDDSFHSTSFLPLNVSLDSYFSDCLKTFNVIHINAQSIPAHFPDMLASFESRNLHAILVSESWLKTCLPSTSYSLPGFRLIRNDRVGRGGGGVAIYLRSYIPFSIVSSSAQPPLPDAAEHLLVEVLLSHTKILLGVFYCPPSVSNYFHSFETLLEKVVPLYSHSIIMGDFNTCLLKDDFRSKKLITAAESCSLSILPLAATHNSPGCTPSLLDLIMVSSTDFVFKHGQCPADAFSYHDLIFLCYTIRPPKSKSRIILQRNFGGIDKSRLCEDASRLDWTAVTDVDSIDQKVEVFNTLITQLYDTHAPVRPIKVKHLPAPWLSDDLKVSINRKNAAKYKYKVNNSENNRVKYCKLRNRCNTLCRDAQRRHIHKSVENCDTTKTWKFLESLGVGRSS